MHRKTLAAVTEHAIASYPRECVGLIVGDGRRERYVPCRNLAAGGDHFVLAPEDYAAAEDQGPVLALVHSHPDAPATPSAADRVSCEASGLPWHIVSVRRGDDGALQVADIASLAPSGYQAPLLGRPFFHGVLDCYSIVRDYYARERGITLPDFERADGWWEGERELYLENFAVAGFRALDEGEPLQPGDVILMQARSRRTNHAGIYLGASELSEAPQLAPVPDAMLHHLYGRLSERTVYGGHWRNITRLIVRYQPS